MKKKLGEMIYETILSRHINQKDLCAGLCSATSFSRYLNGEGTMDRLLLTVILQRLGKSPDKFATLLTEDEYRYFEWKQKICIAQMRKDWHGVEKLLTEKIAKDRSCNEKLQEQFFLLMQAIIQEKLHRKPEESVVLLKQAILITVPCFENGLSNNVLLGVQEISAILLWQRLQPNQDVAMGVLKKMLWYADSHYEDQQEKCKIYPKVVAQYLPLLYEKGEYAECLSLAPKALGLMISTGYTLGIETILCTYIEAAKELGLTDTVKKETVWLEAWRELMREIDLQIEKEENSLYQLDVWQEIVLLHEMIYWCRQERGFTQENLCEEICTPETISRIETGKRLPNKKTYTSLAEKLSLPKERYFSTIETDDFQVLDLRWELEICIIQKNFEAAQKKLEQLIGQLDLSIALNCQYVEEIRYVLNKSLERIPKEERFGVLITILRKTMKDIPDDENVSNWPEKVWMRAFSEREMSILLQVADALAVNHKWTEAITLLEKMLAYYERSKVAPEFHYRIVILIYARLSGYYGVLKNWERQLFYSEKGIKLTAECGNRKSMSLCINNKANALENLEKKDAALQFYKLAFYVSELMQTTTGTIAKRSYEKLSGDFGEWY